MQKRKKRAMSEKAGLMMHALRGTMLAYVTNAAQGSNNGLALHRARFHLRDELLPKAEEEIRNYCLDLGARDADLISEVLRKAVLDTVPALGSSLGITFQIGMSAGSTSKWIAETHADAEGYVHNIPVRTRVAVERRRVDDPNWIDRFKSKPLVAGIVVLVGAVTYVVSNGGKVAEALKGWLAHLVK
jgi:hypothetical protein